MKSAGVFKLFGLVALATAVGPFAAAQDPGWYMGANIGRSKARLDEPKITSGQLGAGSTTTAVREDDRDTGYKLLGGYQFTRHLALEGGYFDLGKFGFTADTLPAGTLKGSIKIRGLNLDAVGLLPITGKLSALGRVGVIHAEARDSFTGAGSVTVSNPHPRKRATNLKLGAGLQFDFNKVLGVRAEAERYRIDDAVGHKADIDLISVGVVYRFARGMSSPAPASSASPPPTPAPVIAEAPVLIVVPVPARTQQYCTILDIQFEINEEVIQREEKEKLAVIGTFLTRYPDTTAVIEGHTDDVGTPEHNLALSQRRAESVVSYLVDTLHIAAYRLTAVGYGGTRPLAANTTEEGKRKNRRIDAVVACVTDIEGLKVAPARITMALLIEFDRNRAEIRSRYHDDLRKVADFLKANPVVTATVEGHTGNLQGSPGMAQDISQRRAQNVVDYLVDTFGIARARLTAEGFGQTRRFAYSTSTEGQQENRRVNIIIDYPN